MRGADVVMTVFETNKSVKKSGNYNFEFAWPISIYTKMLEIEPTFYIYQEIKLHLKENIIDMTIKVKK